MSTDGKPDSDGNILLTGGQKVATTDKIAAPVTFRFIVLTNINDTRIAYAADQIIFNWEMNHDELRVDGGPANGQYKPDAGRLPPNQWVGIELVVHANEMVIYINGVEKYRAKGDFSKVDMPFTITAHNGVMKIKSVAVVSP